MNQIKVDIFPLHHAIMAWCDETMLTKLTSSALTGQVADRWMRPRRPLKCFCLGLGTKFLKQCNFQRTNAISNEQCCQGAHER